MRLFVIAILLIAISGCTSKEDSIKRGEVLFNKKHLGKNRVIGCVACHSIEPDQVIVGPSLAGLSIRAPHLVADQSAQEYIRESILNPDAYIVNGYLPATMFSHYKQELTEKEISHLVAYMSRL